VIIEDPLNNVEISPASYWKIAIKTGLGKYALPEPYQSFMEREIAENDFRILPIEHKHRALLTTMPLHHKDPLDRLLVAQANVEGIPLVTIDAQLDVWHGCRRPRLAGRFAMTCRCSRNSG
jgi:PIN domain nuclease of toxin-antitoxin system